MRQDLLFSLRELRKQPGFALTAILSLTLGIGATTAVFSVIYALLVDPFPYLGADRMIELNVLNERGDNWGVGVTGPQLKILRQAECVESVAASWGTWNLLPRVRTYRTMFRPRSSPATPGFTSAYPHIWGAPSSLRTHQTVKIRNL
jgi:hypothetical protein